MSRTARLAQLRSIAGSEDMLMCSICFFYSIVHRTILLSPLDHVQLVKTESQ